MLEITFTTEKTVAVKNVFAGSAIASAILAVALMASC
jgi:hypothetical protein